MIYKKKVQSRIFEWWKETGRVLPWREKLSQEAQSVREDAFYSYFDTHSYRDPYRVVVSEIMLQQTQVDRVLPKYRDWIGRWPGVEDLAQATLAEVIIEWKGLGYNRRARFLWLLAKEIAENRKGEWPRSEKELMKLPGIGRYTARAVLSFAFGEQVGVIDTNVKRIYQRILDETPLKPDEFFVLADTLLPSGLADPWNQALMDFGALICTAKSPRCEICPIADLCAANIHAQKEGFENFKMKLQTFEKIQRVPKKSKDYAKGKALAFEDTDRFLRGRVLDLLRDKVWNREELIDVLSTKFTQFNKQRIDENIERLAKDQMIREINGKLILG